MPKITKPLSNAAIKSAAPKEKEYTLTDGNGLFLLVLPNGSKSWRFNYIRPLSNKRTKMALGLYPEISLADARVKREEYRALLAQGIDPQEHKKKALEATSEQIKNSFLAVAEKWKEKKIKEVELKTLEKNWRRLELYAFPKLGQMPITEILPATVIQMLEPLNQQGKGDTLKRTIRLINEILNYAVNYGLLQFNPCLNVNAVFNFGKNEHNPTIRPEELPALLKAIRDSRLTLFTRCLIKFQLLTLTRSIESSGAKWPEIDFDNRLWTIPAERMKTRKIFVVPLSTQSLEVLRIMANYTIHDEYVFQSARAKDKPMNSQSVNKALRDLGYEGKLTGHGLRAIGSTYLNEYEPMISPDVIEACLSHGIKNPVRRAYNRSDYLEQRKAVMQLWSDFIENCENNTV